MRALPDNLLRCMSAADRRALGQQTAAEAQGKYLAGEEKRLQKDIAQLLNLKGAWYRTSRMDRRTTGRVGEPDFVGIYRGSGFAIECKVRAPLTAAQARELEAIQKAGGFAIVARSVADALQLLREIDAAVED